MNLTSSPDLSFPTLSALESSDLETLKTRLDVLRQEILALQNARAPLLRLPGELRNQIFQDAMRAELVARSRDGSSHTLNSLVDGGRENLYADPRFLRTCRCIRDEAVGIWFAEVVAWEEWTTAEKPGDGNGNRWRRLSGVEVRELQGMRSRLGKGRMVTQMAFGGIDRARAAVMESKSVCPRQGIARVEGMAGLPGMRWWVW